MSDIVCRVKISGSELPKVVSSISKLDGKGRNEMIRMFMRLALAGVSYPLDTQGAEDTCFVRLSVTQSSHHDLFEHLKGFPSRFRAAEVVRMLHSIESESTIYAVPNSASNSREQKSTEERVSQDAPTKTVHAYDDVVINESDMELAELI